MLGMILLVTFVFALAFYAFYRNEAVYKMRLRVNHACYNYETYCLNLCATNGDWELLNIAYIITDEMRHRNNYDKMFFSFRPVKIEKWYTPTECEIIEKFSTDDLNIIKQLLHLHDK